MCIQANHYLSADMDAAMKHAADTEQSELGKKILHQLQDNLKIADEEMIPICQDTGMAVIFLEVGQDVHFEGTAIEDAVNEGVRQGYTEGFLRKSVVGDPLIRENTKDNTPAVIHYSIVPGDQVKITMAPKGFGSENMSRMFMLKPADGDAKAFGPFLPENMDFARCLDMASEFWEAMNDLKENRLNLNTIRTAQGLAPLCPSCFWKEDCPRFKGSSHPEWDAALAQLMDLKVQKKSLDEAIGELEVRLKVAYQLSHTVRGEWINTGNHTFRVIPQSGRVTLDRKRLAEELKNLLGEQKAQTLMARCEKQGEPFGRLYAVQTANEF